MLRAFTISLLLCSFCLAPNAFAQSNGSITLTFGQATPVNAALPPYSIDELERRTFHYFWDLNDEHYQVPDRWPTMAFSSIAATGFGLSAYLVGAERGWITREQAADRVLKTLLALKDLPQGEAAEGIAGYRGFYYHFLDHKKALRFRDVELSTIDSGLLMAGILSTQTYFDQSNPTEKAIRDAADFLYRRVEWDWMLNVNQRISMGWKPESGFIQNEWFGYTEAMILYVLAMASPTHPIPESSWDAWCQNYYWDTYQGQEHLNFGPLFGHQYSHIWIDFKGIQDKYMRAKGIDYAENTRRATLSNWEYCRKNPGNFKDYSEKIWGLTACDGPADWLAKNDREGQCRDREKYMGYSARGVATDYLVDDGTIAPTAAGGSVPFAPEICLPALETMWNTYGDSLVGKYGFKDAFNPTFTACGRLPNGWFDVDYLGIDQGPIILMLENYRSGLIWNLMKKNPYIQKGMRKAGFTGGWTGRQPEFTKFQEDVVLPNNEVPTSPQHYFDRGIYRENETNALPYRLLRPSNILETNQIPGYWFNKNGELIGIEKSNKDKKLKLPLVIFLHGSGERGNDNEAQLRNGVYAFCESKTWTKHPCFVLAPQCPENMSWESDEVNDDLTEKPGEGMRLLMALIDKTIAENPAIDQKRIYLTGLSMGGFGTFELLMRRPELFAAGVPVCGGGDPTKAALLKNIPLWVFHGIRDQAVPIKESRDMVKAIEKAGGKPRFTEYSTLGHGAWQETYYNPEMMEWLFLQRKK